MTDTEKPRALANIDSMIIARALKKAIKNGYDLGQGDPDKLVDYAQFLIDQGVVMAVLTQHKFCQALWGGETALEPNDVKWPIHKWQYHLQQMVITDDPIEYLAKNI